MAMTRTDHPTRFAVMGPSRAGKTSVARQLAEGWTTVHGMIDPVRALCTAAGVRPTRANLIWCAQPFRSLGGEGALARVAVATSAGVVDGVRLESEIQVLRAENVQLVYVETPLAVREERRFRDRDVWVPQFDAEAEALRELADWRVSGVGGDEALIEALRMMGELGHWVGAADHPTELAIAG